jgi:SAM-dependent methyltransferase
MIGPMRADTMAYYRLGGETTRLAGGNGRLEYIRTRDVLQRTLPPAPARVVDVGGATGVYAGPLAAAGYDVTLVDPVPEHVAASDALDGVTAVIGDARALDLPDGTADATLLLGPLYHLLDRADRIRAWREAARVTRPGGVVVAATISRFASILDGFRSAFFAEPDYAPIVTETLASGVQIVPGGSRWQFTGAYFHRPEEIPAEVVDAGLAVERIVAVEGPPWLTDWAAASEETTLEWLRRVEEEPSMLGASSHLLTIVRS